MARYAACAFVLVVVALCSFDAEARPVPCMPSQILQTQLQSTFKEQHFMTGTFSRDRAMRAYANPETSTWSMIMILPDGRACIIAAGKDLDLFPLIPLKPKTETP